MGVEGEGGIKKKKIATILEYGGKGEEHCKIKQIYGVGIPKPEQKSA